MVKIIWSDHAISNLKEIHDYIARDSFHYAAIFTESLVNRVETIAAFPNKGRVVPEEHNPLVREVIYRNYRIIYEIKDDHIELLSIFHGSKQY